MEKSINYVIKGIFVFSVICYILALFLIPKVEIVEKRENEYAESENTDVTIEPNTYLDEDTIKINEVLIDNMDELFSKYTGELSRGNISEFLRKILLLEIYNLKEEKINKNYFFNNKEDIIRIYGIQEYTDFIDFYNYIKDYEEKVNTITIEKDSIVMKEEKTEFTIEVLFQNGNKKYFKCIIRNYISSNAVEEPNIVIDIK